MKTLAASLLLVPVALMVVGCSKPPEQQFLTQFFRATRARDNTTIGRMSAIEIDARTQGTVEDFSITSISPETRTPLTFAPLFEAAQKAKDEETAFLKTKIEYQNANIKAIEEVLKIEQMNPTAKLTPAQEKVRLEWAKWREGIAAHAKAEASARAAISNSTGLAEASLTQPNQPPLDPKTFQGETITKDVIVKAKVKSPDGATSDKTLTITIERVASNAGGTTREGRPIITKIAGL
ncbi:MAG: hypothetical protein Q7J25_04985 [Vicinamibacterales bacterium]|nr:hypothetical protein [Vicinamibacterales bacterium]